MSNSLVVLQSNPSYMQTLKWQSQTLIAAGDMIPAHWKSPAAVVSAMMLADELGIGRVTALRGMYSVKGKVSLSSQLMLALCQASGELEDFKVEGDAKSATCTAKRKGVKSPMTITFTYGEAEALGLTRTSGRPGSWQTQPAVMLRWRAISAVLRVLFADRLEGLYTHEELGRPVVVTDEGDIELDDSSVVEVVPNPPSTPTPEPKKSEKKTEEKPQEAEETTRIDPKAVVESATPWGSKEAEKAAREHGNKVAKEKIEKQAAASEQWFAKMSWHTWMDAALKTVGNKEFKDTTLENLNRGGGRTRQNWIETAETLKKWLEGKGKKVPPFPVEDDPE